MTELSIHQCLISNGVYPMTLIIKSLEEQNRYEECKVILNAMLSYKEKYINIPIVRWSRDFEKEYQKPYIEEEGEILSLLKETLEYRLKDIKEKLALN